MSLVATETLIRPHGGTLVDRTGSSPDDLDALEVVTLTPREVSDLDLLASGALSPLEGFMGREDYDSVVESMHLVGGLPWALPVCLAVDEAPSGDRVALAHQSRRPHPELQVAHVYDNDNGDPLFRWGGQNYNTLSEVRNSLKFEFNGSII